MFSEEDPNVSEFSLIVDGNGKKIPQLKAYVQTQDFSFTGLGSMHTDSSGDIGHTLDSCPQDTLTETQM